MLLKKLIKFWRDQNKALITVQCNCGIPINVAYFKMLIPNYCVFNFQFDYLYWWAHFKVCKKKNILIIMLSVWANVTFVEKLLGFYGSQLLLYSYGNRVSKVNCAMVGPFWLKKYETYIKYFQFLKIIFLSIRDSILLHIFFWNILSL